MFVYHQVRVVQDDVAYAEARASINEIDELASSVVRNEETTHLRLFWFSAIVPSQKPFGPLRSTTPLIRLEDGF